MRRNLRANAVNLDFLDGYLFCQMQSALEQEGAEASGLLEYYTHRVNTKAGGLVEYEEKIARYLLSEFKGRRIVHPGTGLGTLPCALACNGGQVLGIEVIPSRVVTTRRIREALIRVWPEVGDRYHLIEGRYPEAIRGSPWIGKDTVVVFTNFASDGGEEINASIIDSLQDFGDVLLDLRLFCGVREKEEERISLFARISAKAKHSERLPHVMEEVKLFHLARFTF